MDYWNSYINPFLKKTFIANSWKETLGSSIKILAITIFILTISWEYKEIYVIKVILKTYVMFSLMFAIRNLFIHIDAMQNRYDS